MFKKKIVPLIKRSFLSEQKNVPIRSLCFGRTSFPFPFQRHRAIVSLAERNPHNSPGGRKTRQFVKARVAKLIGVLFSDFCCSLPKISCLSGDKTSNVFWFCDVLWMCIVGSLIFRELGSMLSWPWFFPITDAFVFMEPFESSLINRLCTEWS